MVLSTQRQNTGRGRKGDLGSKGILMSPLETFCLRKSWESICVLSKGFVDRSAIEIKYNKKKENGAQKHQ